MFTIITPSQKVEYIKLTNWMNAILKLKYSEELKEDGVQFTIESFDHMYYNQMLENHDMKIINFLEKSYDEIFKLKNCYEEICGQIKL